MAEPFYLYTAILISCWVTFDNMEYIIYIHIIQPYSWRIFVI